MKSATSKQIESAISAIEASRPDLGDAINLHFETRSNAQQFDGSEAHKAYETACDAYDSKSSMLDHLKVALSVAIANEYISGLESDSK